MNYGLVVRVIGNLLLIEALLMGIPLVVSIIYGEVAVTGIAWAIGITGLIGFLFTKVNARSRSVKAREALVIVTFGWLLASFFSSLLFVFTGSIPNIVDAFFESVSGLSTTGATILDNVEILPRGVLFWRSFTHWLGGMGIIVFTMAILPALGVGGFQIYKAEVPGPTADKLVPRLADTAKILYTVYFGLTSTQVILLWTGGMSFFEALIFSFGTVGTGGFSIYNASLGGFAANSFVIFVIAIFMIASGVNMSLYYDLWHRRWRNVVKNNELRLYLGIVLFCTLAITINLLSSVGAGIWETFKHALFQVGSIISTTGYTTVDYDEWPEFSKAILFILMFVGGMAGSTAGSVKVIRLLVAGKVVRREVYRILHSRAHVPITVNGRSISQETVTAIAGFYFLYFGLFVAGTLLISLEGLGLVTSASAAASAIGNIGPGFGLVGPTFTFSQFSMPSKLLLSVLMLLGRLEFFTVVVIFTPSFWRQ